MRGATRILRVGGTSVWIAVIASSPMWLFGASSLPPIATSLVAVASEGAQRRDGRSLPRREFVLSIVATIAVILDLFIAESFTFGNLAVRWVTATWAVAVIALPREARRVLAANLFALLLVASIAEVGTQVVIGRRLSSEEVLAQFRVKSGGPRLDPDRRVTEIDGYCLGVFELQCSRHGKLRTTIAQPADPDFRVFVFGGSTVYCSEVDDAETLPSALQALLNASGVRASVLNFGKVIVDAVFSNAWLHDLTPEDRPRPGDIVIFYIGVNDAGASFSYTSRIDRWAAQYDNLAVPMGFLNRHSAIASQVFAWLGRGRVTPNDQTSALAAALDDARRYTEELGARFVPVLQPTLFTEASPDRYESRLAARYGDDLARTLAEIYPRVSERVLAVPGAVDARGSLASVSPSPFVDWMHLDARGNAAISEVLLESVLSLVERRS